MSRPSRQQVLVAALDELSIYVAGGRPTGTPTVTVFNGGDDSLDELSVALTDATATLNSFEQDITVAATENATELVVGSTSGLFIGDRYWVTNHRRQSEEVFVDGYDATTIVLVDPLQIDIEVGGAITPTISSHRLSIAIPAASFDEVVRDARVAWTYTVNGRAKTVVEYYDAVLQKSEWPVSTSDLREQWMEFPEFVGTPRKWERLIEGARHDLEGALIGSRMYPDLLRDMALAKRYIVARAIETYHRPNGSQDGQFVRRTWNAAAKAAFVDIQNYYRWFVNGNDVLETLFGSA